MADQGLHALTENRSLAERYFWLWIALAFLVGLVPGVLGLLWYRNSAASYNATLVEQRNTLNAQNAKLAADKARLESEVASAQAAATPQSGSSNSGSDPTSSAPVPTPKPGEITFVDRNISPSPVSAGAKLSLSTTIAGKATDAYMQVQSSDRSVSKIWQLHKGAANGNAVTWIRSDATAPKNPGAYVVLSWAYVGTKKSLMPGAGELTVK
jgi:hypothetical protein